MTVSLSCPICRRKMYYVDDWNQVEGEHVNIYCLNGHQWRYSNNSELIVLIELVALSPGEYRTGAFSRWDEQTIVRPVLL